MSENLHEMKNSLSDIEKRVLYIYYLADESLYCETISKVMKIDQRSVDVTIEKLEKKGLIKEK